MTKRSAIVAKNLFFSMPLSAPTDRSFRSNPAAFLRALAGGSNTRLFRPLIRGVSFEFTKGERVGLIGQNGAGKTTLLRLLGGVLMPSAGRLEIHGATQTLLNVSMGMQPEATGMENIYLRGYCAGLSGDEIEERIPEILEFAELSSVINDPVRTYSSGMRLRLAFAVATSVKPQILLLDEWLSAGDRFFVERSKRRLLGHIDASEILVFASHNPRVLSELCGRGLVLKHGMIVFDGDIDAALAFYESDEYQAIDETFDVKTSQKRSRRFVQRPPQTVATTEGRDVEPKGSSRGDLLEAPRPLPQTPAAQSLDDEPRRSVAKDLQSE